MSLAMALLGMLLLLLAKGFFSGSEIAVVSADRVRLRARAARGEAGARLALALLADPPRLLTTTLLGTNITSVALTTLGTILMVGAFGGQGELLALLIFTPVFLILGEIVPKSVYQQKADAIVPVIAHPLSWVQTVLSPLVWVFGGVAGLAARLAGKGRDEREASYEQFVATVQMAEQTGASPAFAQGQIRRVVRFARMTAAEVMWPLARSRSLTREAGVAALLETRRTHGQRLVPLYEGGPSNVTAVAAVDIWDLLDPDVAGREMDAFLAPVRFVPNIQRVSEIIEILHDAPNTVAVVVDETGAALGLITLNLLVRRTLGAETSAVTDRATAAETGTVERRPDGTVAMDASLSIAKVNEELGTMLPTLNQSTLGGFALSVFGHLPETGESFESEGYRFTAAEVSMRRIERIEARRLS